MKVIPLKQKWVTSSVFRYIIIGAWNTFFSLLLLYMLFYLFTSNHYEIELGITFIISSVQSFFAQRIFVWQSSDVVRKELIRFFAGTSSQYLLNSFSIYILDRELHFNPTYVALPLMLTITSLFYFVNKHMVFK
jgi:putative flippase GtrA